MLLYYGADRLVEKPEFGKGNANNDYGLGFYLTSDKRMAQLWASKNINGGYVIVGYRADDSYFKYSKDFIENKLSLEVLAQAMKLGKLGIQYVLVSQKAFSRIQIKDYTFVEHSDEYEKFRVSTLNGYNVLKERDLINNTYIRDIMRKNKCLKN